MPKLTIDQRDVEVPEGATILDAAQKLGIEIPTLCYRPGCDPSTSCLVCTVRVGRDHRLVPACATAALDGMEVESESEAVHQVRRSALELLLSDHLGDCLAPCYFACPAEMDIPSMLRQIAAGDLRGAIATVKHDIALPAVLGRICPAPCEKICRRGDLDGPVSICLLKRLAADVDLASPEPYAPACLPASGKHVAVIGAGPTGLSAAYYLRQYGHACTLFDENRQLGGRLLHEPKEGSLPAAVLDAEIAAILRLGVSVQTEVRIELTKLAELRSRFDAVLLACGATGKDQALAAGLAVSQRGIHIEPHTYHVGAQQSHLEELPDGVFAAGNAIRGKGLVVRSVADGKEAAHAIHQYLSGQAVTGWPRPFNTKIGRMSGDELIQLANIAPALPANRAKSDPLSSTSGWQAMVDLGETLGLTPAEGRQQASRCLHCDCRGVHSCKLREYAAKYHANPRRYATQRRVFQVDARHAEVIYEPGKCIACGLCIQIAAAAGEPLGLTFVGRGFDVRVSVPFDRSLAEALSKAAAVCVAACPTAALAYKESTHG
jgi:NADPH-dependent glutamate synthase beta subunit-like oxidoreductase